jgi:hypothetical protein
MDYEVLARSLKPDRMVCIQMDVIDKGLGTGLLFCLLSITIHGFSGRIIPTVLFEYSP